MNRRRDDTLHDDAFIVVPDGEEVWPHVKEAAARIIPDSFTGKSPRQLAGVGSFLGRTSPQAAGFFTNIDEEGNVFDGECRPGVVRYHEVEVEGWRIVAWREEGGAG